MQKLDFTASNWNVIFQVCVDMSSYGANPPPVAEGLTLNNPQFQLTWTNNSLVLLLDAFYRSNLTDFSQTLTLLSSVSKESWHDHGLL
jgi:hypothetical protein